LLKATTAIDQVKKILTKERSYGLEQEAISFLLKVDFEQKLLYTQKHIMMRNLSKQNELLLYKYLQKTENLRSVTSNVVSSEGTHETLNIRLKSKRHSLVLESLEKINNFSESIPLELAYNIFYFGNMSSKKVACNILLRDKINNLEILKLYQTQKELKEYCTFQDRSL
jgi:hypothetical protein